MTNEQIIFSAEQNLAKDGLLKYTGRVLQFQDVSGGIVEFKETEQIHTFQYWKANGYRVRKGEKAVARFAIWKRTAEKETKTQEGEPVIIPAKMFLKESCFFSASQVEKITA